MILSEGNTVTNLQFDAAYLNITSDPSFLFTERTVVVSQYCGKPLIDFIEKKEYSFQDLKKITYQALMGLKELHDHNIVHRNLSTENILLQDNGNIKLFNYGLYYITDNGKLVSFPIM